MAHQYLQVSESEVYQTHLSPFWRSPTAMGGFMLWRAQSIVPSPVAARPRFDLVSAMFTALWLEQVDFCLICQYSL